MPAVHFTIRWPDGRQERCYSPSRVVRDFLQVGRTYRIDEFVSRSRTMLNLASERVREKFGAACSAALDQLASIEASAAEFAADGRVAVLALEPPGEGIA